MSNRRSSRLAIKKRVDYNEVDQMFIDTNLDQKKISSDKEIVQNEDDVQVQPFMKNDHNSFIIDNNENQKYSSNNESQYTFSNSKEMHKDLTKVNDENPLKNFGRITKVNKTIFRQTSKTLSDLKFAIESTKAAVYSFESCLKGKNKSLFDDNASIINNNDDNKMDTDEFDEINVIDDDNSVIECKNDESHNIHNINNSLKITKNEGIEDSELNDDIIDDQENQSKIYSEQVQDIQLQKQDLDLMEVDHQQPIPQFSLMLSGDLKEAFKPNLPISTSLEDTDIVVYDPTDPDFNGDDLIVTLIERKQNMTTRRKIRLNSLLSSKSQNMKSIDLQTNAYDQITKKQDMSTSHIVCIDDKDENLKNQANEKQDIFADSHGRQEQQQDVNMIDFNLISENESKVQDQSVAKDESKVCKDDVSENESKVQDQSVTKDESKVRKDDDKDIKNSTSNENLDVRTASQNINKDDDIGNKFEIQKDNSEDEDITDVVEEIVMESSDVSKFQEVSISSMSKSSNESIKSQVSQSDVTSIKNLERNLNISKKPPSNDIICNKKNKKPKSNVKKSLKNAKSVESMTELISSPSVPNSSVSKVIPAKRPVPDDSKTSEDILGPFLELLDENRKKETSSIQKQSATNITDVPPNYRVEMMNLPYSSMSSEEHRKYLQIESMIHHNANLVSKDEHNFYQNMSERVKNERKNFERWQFERSKLFIGHLNQLIENKVMSHLKYGRQSNINDYSRIELTIGLNPVSLGEPELKFKQKLNSIGKHFEFSVPTAIVNQIPIQLEKELWLDDTPSANTISTDSAVKDYWQKMRVPVVSQDPLIPEMLSNHKVDIVISSGGLSALVGLAESTDVELEIPIKMVEVTKENSVLKTIYIDKPFVNKRMTPREINQVYYNTAFKSMVLKMDTCIDISNVENKDVELQNSSHNLEYSLWNIDDISILIRCKSNGYCRESDQKIRTVGIKTKLDYQLDYNYESISSIEQSRWWIHSMIRNKADLMLGRIDVPTNTLNMIEKVSAENILADESRVKSLIKKLYYIFNQLQRSLSQGSHILRHEKGEAYAVVFRSFETAETDSLTSLRHIKIDRETIPFVPLVWKGLHTQIKNTFPIRTEQFRGPPQRKSKKKFNVPSEKSKPKPKSKSKSKSKSKKSKDNGGWKDNGGCDDLQYIADNIVDPKNFDLDNMEESNGTSALDFATLLNNFKK
ncbi:hypothetical protein RclHR1_10090004 [Rhizophagus clarus]|uniref:Little elongation complex subunit 2 C-terminal domain-containing protein n=1 Tax=Rhizophagus clarus TaxID=94130 RepID=A0A2Z6Q0X2_9GLOM|nr:hypothetical protein RclHR1_10090004 [Rhizophagus clarus]